MIRQFSLKAPTPRQGMSHYRGFFGRHYIVGTLPMEFQPF
nr:MAG TPA: hypothetical protein [Bacteriophage sp.]